MEQVMARASKSRFVSYLRVSTARQGASGLGLEAQRAAVAAQLIGGDSALLREIVEIESGKQKNGELCWVAGVCPQSDSRRIGAGRTANLQRSDGEGKGSGAADHSGDSRAGNQHASRNRCRAECQDGRCAAWRAMERSPGATDSRPYSLTNGAQTSGNGVYRYL